MMKLVLRKIFGMLVIFFTYFSNVLWYTSKYPEESLPWHLVSAVMAIIFSPPILFSLIVGIYFLFSKKFRKIDYILVAILIILFLPITPGCTIFPTPGFILWETISPPFYFCKPETHFLQGNATLKVIVLAPDDTSVKNLEVDLWTENASGPPNAGINYTNKDGVVIFKIPEGSYKIGFNAKNFPKNLIYPEPITVNVTEEKPIEEIIKLKPK
jgi:hypothetical protein